MEDFNRTYVVRGYEVDGTRVMPLPVALSFLEQLRWEWMVAPGWGLAEGVELGFFFVVRHQILELVEKPRFGDRLTVRGRLEKVGRSQVVVRHRLEIDERVIGHALVRGVWLGPNRRLARIPDAARELGRRQAKEIPPWDPPVGADSDAVLGTSPSYLDAPRHVFRARGIELKTRDFEPTSRTELVVRPSDCDVFQHVNASQYLRYCEDALLAAGGEVRGNRVLLDYADEALAGQTIAIELAPDGELWQARVTREGRLLCGVVLG